MTTDPAETREGISLAPRSAARAVMYSAVVLGGGQIYNKQLEKAVLLWIWGALHLGGGLFLLVLGMLGAWLPASVTRPPLGDWIAGHASGTFLAWFAAGLLLWGAGIRDAAISAGRINRGEVIIRYAMRRQMVHVLASQVLGFIPLVGLFFPPGVVAEALDAVHQKRGPDHRRLLREGGQAVIEWVATRIAVWGLGLSVSVWAVWWVLRAFRLAP